MAVTGRKPSEAPVRHRVQPTHEWTEVVNVPFDGPSPNLPGRLANPEATAWWEAVRHMPHAALWSPSDWQFALATAEVAHAFFAESAKDYAAELRQREKIMGLTLDARRDLRIRYVDAPDKPAAASASRPARDPRLRVVRPDPA